MNKEIQEHIGIVIPVLNVSFEERHSASLSPEELQRATNLSEQQLRRVIDTLLAAGWIEKAREFIGGYTIRLTPFGKQEFDRQTHNHNNSRIRQSLAAALAETHEKDPHQLTDSDALADKLGVDRNAVCFNLIMMQQEGHVQLSAYAGAGHEAHTVRLTPRGKALFDNPDTQVLFISHAAVDKPIAVRLREALEYAFPNIRVFVSSAPDALKPGDPWVQKILDALESAKAAIILVTDRGLTRYWVWYEAGAAWAKRIDTIYCCLGKQHKGTLPAPFSLSQAVDLHDPADLNGLFTKLSELFDRPATPNFQELASELKSLNDAAEEQFERLVTPQFAERKNTVVNTLNKLDEVQKEALRLALIHGEVTDHYALTAMQLKGLQCGNWASVYPGLELSTALVQQVPGTGDLRRGDKVRFRITPDVKLILAEVLFRRNEAE